MKDGSIRLALPKDATGRSAWHAAHMVVPPSGWMDTARVGKDHLPILVATLEHYYLEIDLLTPEGQEGEGVAEVEEVSPLSGLDPETAEKAYKALVRVLHPDVGGSHEAFVKLQSWAEKNRGDRGDQDF